MVKSRPGLKRVGTREGVAEQQSEQHRDQHRVARQRLAEPARDPAGDERQPGREAMPGPSPRALDAPGASANAALTRAPPSGACSRRKYAATARTMRPSSFGAATGRAASALLMPSSLAKASATISSSAAMSAFQPHRPTRVSPRAPRT